MDDRCLLTGRAHHLDGLRGVAAIAVMLLHFCRSFDNAWLALGGLNMSPLSVLWNGHFAVQVFFVLSGYLFYGKFDGADWGAVMPAFVKRYLRLTGPVLAVSLAAWALHAAGAFQNVEAAALDPSNWLVQWYRFPPDFGFAVREAVLSAYVGFEAAHSYNGNLWTIAYELFVVGAVMVLATARGQVWVRYALLALGLALSWKSYAFGFFVGALVFRIGADRRHDLPWWAGLTLTLMGCAGGAFFPLVELDRMMVYPLAAGLLLYAINHTRVLRTGFASAPLRFLGEISFGLYLIHMPVLCSASSALALYRVPRLLNFIVYLTLTVAAAWLLIMTVDRPWQRMCRRLVDKA